MDEWMESRLVDGWMDGWKDRSVDGWMDEWMER
jgi:hypothetical protein